MIVARAERVLAPQARAVRIRSAAKGARGGERSLDALCALSLRPEELAADLCILPVTGMPIRSQWHLVHPRAKQLSPIARVFREHLLDQARHWPLA